MFKGNCQGKESVITPVLEIPRRNSCFAVRQSNRRALRARLKNPNTISSSKRASESPTSSLRPRPESRHKTLRSAGYLVMVPPVFTRQHLELETPTRMDGISVKKEARLRNSYCQMIETAGMALRLPPYLVSTAIFLAHQFFAVRSMKRNDRFLVATAALYLASKIEDPVRNVMDIMHHTFNCRFKNDPVNLKAFRDAEFQAQLREAVLEAESQLLHITGFDFFIDQPQDHVFNLLEHLGLSTKAPQIQRAVQLTWALIRDSRRSTLWLQFNAKTLAVALFILACRYLSVEIDFAPAWRFIGDREGRQAVGEICAQMAEMYEPGDLHMYVSQQDSSSPV